jgi:TetR/AcrR family transcriptional regulator
MNNADLIIATALKEFSTRGYEAVGVQEIVDIVGVTKPTLYHYFNGKRGLLEAIIKRNVSGFLQAFTQASEYQYDLTYSLQKMLTVILEFAQTDSVFFKYFSSLRYAPRDSVEKACVTPAFDLIDSRLRQLFLSSVAEHGNLRGKEEIQAVTFWGFAVEIVSLVLDGKMEVNTNTVYHALHQFEHGIYS